MLLALTAPLLLGFPAAPAAPVIDRNATFIDADTVFACPSPRHVCDRWFDPTLAHVSDKWNVEVPMWV